MGKNLRLFLLLEVLNVFTLIYLCKNASVQIEGRASVHLISPGTTQINQFFEEAKAAEMQANDNFWPSELKNSNQNQIQSIGVLLPKHNEKRLLDSAHFTVRFFQAQNEPDYITEKRISEILKAAILKDSISAKSMQLQYRSMLQLVRQIESTKIIMAALANEADTSPRNRISEPFNFLQKSRKKYAINSRLSLKIESLEKKEIRPLRPAILSGLLIQAGVVLFFLLRFLLLGK